MTGDRKHCKRCGKLDECFAVCPWCLDAVERAAAARAPEIAKLTARVVELETALAAVHATASRAFSKGPKP